MFHKTNNKKLEWAAWLVFQDDNEFVEDLRLLPKLDTPDSVASSLCQAKKK